MTLSPSLIFKAKYPNKVIGEFAVMGFGEGHNPFPSKAARLAWVRERLAMMGPRAGMYWIVSDLGSSDLVLLHGNDYDRQRRDGADLVSLGSVVVLGLTHAALLDRLNSSTDTYTDTGSV